MDERRPPGSEAREGLAVAGMAAFAIACCAALPLVVALAGGVAVGTVLGIGAGAVALGGLVALIIIRQRAKRRHRG